MLTVTSLLLIILTMVHLAQDIAYGYEPGNINNLIAVPIAVVWLYGTLLLSERRSGHIIMLIGSLLAMGMPVIHVMFAAGVFHGALAGSSGPYLFVWTLHMLGVTGMFSLILSVRGLWSLRRSQTR
jgi:hypothetical protein